MAMTGHRVAGDSSMAQLASAAMWESWKGRREEENRGRALFYLQRAKSTIERSDRMGGQAHRGAGEGTHGGDLLFATPLSTGTCSHPQLELRPCGSSWS